MLKYFVSDIIMVTDSTVNFLPYYCTVLHVIYSLLHSTTLLLWYLKEICFCSFCFTWIVSANLLYLNLQCRLLKATVNLRLIYLLNLVLVLRALPSISVTDSSKCVCSVDVYWIIGSSLGDTRVGTLTNG